MNTKRLMTVTSLTLGLIGICALFAPDILLSAWNVNALPPFSLIVQLLGGLYFSFALMNWTVKDSAIGGVYSRPISMANFAHFFIGVLVLVKYQISNPFNLFVLSALMVYAVGAFIFYWLVFQSTGLK